MELLDFIVGWYFITGVPLGIIMAFIIERCKGRYITIGDLCWGFMWALLGPLLILVLLVLAVVWYINAHKKFIKRILNIRVWEPTPNHKKPS